MEKQKNDMDEGIEIPVDVIKHDEDERDIAEEKREPSAEEVPNYLDQLQRLQAEFINYKKRVENEKLELSGYVKSLFMQNILPVVDDLERLVLHHEDEETCSLEAVQLIYKKFLKILADEGMENLNAEGTLFDPEIHEAVAVEEIDNPDDDGKVLAEWQKGYVLRGRLIRPSRVKVGKRQKSIDEKA